MRLLAFRFAMQGFAAQVYFFLKDRVYHRVISWVGALLYWFPSRQLLVIGVTGTKGKSTTVELIAYILERAGKKVAVSSSVRNDASGMTMPGHFFIQRLLRRGVSAGCTHAVIEVTSQGVAQSRHRFIKWDIAVFTNLTREHIEAHGSFEKYREAKLDFFKYVGHRISLCGISDAPPLFIINKNDDNAQYFIDATNLLKFHFNRIVLYAKSELSSNLIGEFNCYNVGAAVAVAEAAGIPPNSIQQAVRDFPGVRGRMEFIQREPFQVVVDYAVTPDSLEAVYQILRDLRFPSSPRIAGLQRAGMNHDSKLICVFGCTGGGRDVWKRPVMGRIAAHYCDEIILTDDDSYDENPLSIIEEIESGFLQRAHSVWQIGKNYWKIIDRGEAIRKALLLARPGDIVIITGKGGDKWLRVAGGKKIPWSDQGVVRDILQEIHKA